MGEKEKSNLEIKFSRHSKRRMKLYGIKKNDVVNVIQKGGKTKIGNKNIYLLKIDYIKYPVKVVTEKKNDYIFIITAYPLKRGRKNES